MAQRVLLTGDQNGGNYPQPEQWDTDYEFVPQVDGVAKSSPDGPSENVRLYPVSFAFAEILPLEGVQFAFSALRYIKSARWNHRLR
jgi:hypothetical protein